MKIRKIIVYLCVFAAAASIFTRIIYVNKVYPSVKIHNYNIGAVSYTHLTLPTKA